jgi:hypothetical protein
MPPLIDARQKDRIVDFQGAVVNFVTPVVTFIACVKLTGCPVAASAKKVCSQFLTILPDADGCAKPGKVFDPPKLGFGPAALLNEVAAHGNVGFRFGLKTGYVVTKNLHGCCHKDSKGAVKEHRPQGGVPNG